MKECRRPLTTLDITGLSHEGRGISRHQDKVIFVFGALPGETVEAQFTKPHRQYIEAKCEQVIKASPLRVKPECEFFGLCGGCQLQHLEPVKQIEFKQSLLAEQLEQAHVKPDSWLPPLINQFYGYRQKGRLGVKFVDKKQALLVGFREQSSNKIAMIDSCAVFDPRVGNHIHDLKVLIGSLEGKKSIPQIEVAIGGEEVALVFRHVEPLCTADCEKLAQFCQSQGFTFYLQPGAPETVHQVWPTPGKNELEYCLSDQNLLFRFHPLDFIQVNAQINQKMINQALDLLSVNTNETVLDLFCGLGNFSLPLAQQAKKVVGVEGGAQMVRRAKNNAELNNLENVEFYSADLEAELSAQTWAKLSYDKILLDPPRSGAQAVVDKIERFNSNKILYVSCNPATFVRDAAILTHHKGYRLEKCGVMDMFPQTAHVETMGLFVKW